jgi:hypothetical protein
MKSYKVARGGESFVGKQGLNYFVSLALDGWVLK